MEGKLYQIDGHEVVDQSLLTSCFSDRELERYSRIKNHERRKRWVGGRLMAKSMFLDYLEEGQEIQRPNICDFQWRDLSKFSPWMLKNIEILTSQHPQNGFLNYIWNGRPTALNLSIAHSRSKSYAFISPRKNIGIDAEFVFENLNEAFYRTNFSQGERHWIIETSSCQSISHDWLYTFIWTLKEAALKASSSLEASLWNIADFDINLNGFRPKLYEYSRSQASAKSLTSMAINVHYKGVSKPYQVDFTGSRNEVVSVLYQLSSNGTTNK